MHYRKVHFIGIGGVGMSATAKLLRDSGVTVTGSDEGVYPPMLDFLQDEGFDWKQGYSARNIPTDAELIVIGKNAKLVPETNEEVKAAFESGKEIKSFPEVLADVAKNSQSVVVAGSYGKSTCTALLAHCLESGDLDPSYFIGAFPFTPKTSARIGKRKLFILEGDEYPASNTDARSKFLLLNPRHVLLTPLAHDHVNVFPTPEDYLKPFTELVSRIPEDGILVVTAESDLSAGFLASLSRPVVTYGVRSGEFQARDIVWGDRTTFTITKNGTAIATVETGLLGEHNIQNIVGVAAFVFSLNLLSPEQFVAAIKSFKGIRRRLDRKSDTTTIPVFEGFGSSYEKARSAIAAMKLHFPERRLVVIFEPHTFSWRNRDALPWYDDVFLGAQKVYVYEPAQQGASTHKQLTQEEIVDRVRDAGFDAVPVTSSKETLELLRADTHEDDAVLLLSSGALGGLIETVPVLLEELFPKN